MPYILSTMSAGVNYAIYGKTAGGLPVVKREIAIAGGSGVINKALVTPQGVVTKVSDEELELLESNALFRMHKAGGFVKVQKSDKTDTKDMEQKDASAQRVEADYTSKNKKAPKVAKL